jgi:hypothetical protein
VRRTHIDDSKANAVPESSLSSAEEQEKSPKEFAEANGINVQNAYFWMRTRGLGRKEGTRWRSGPENEAKMLELEAARPDGKRYAKQPHSWAVRKNYGSLGCVSPWQLCSRPSRSAEASPLSPPLHQSRSSVRVRTRSGMTPRSRAI